MFNPGDKNNYQTSGSVQNSTSQLKIIGQANNSITGARVSYNDNLPNGGQFVVNVNQDNKNIIQQLNGTTLRQNQDQNSYVQRVIQNKKNILKQQLQSELQSQHSISNTIIHNLQENLNPKYQETVKKVRQISLTGDTLPSNTKPLQIHTSNQDKQLPDNISTINNNGNSIQKVQFAEIQQQQQQKNQKSFEQSDKECLHLEQQNQHGIERLFNAVEIVNQNKEISQKVMLLTKELDRLRIIMNENEEENKQLQEKVENLEKSNNMLVENASKAKLNVESSQLKLEISEQRRQEMHKHIEQLQMQLTNVQKEKQHCQAAQLEQELKIQQISSDNQNIISTNENLYTDKYNLIEELAQQQLNFNMFLTKQDKLKKELHQKNDFIRALENDKIQLNQQVKQIEIMKLQQTIETEKVGVELIEVQNQNEQLQSVNKELQETLEELSQRHEELLNEKEVVQNELAITRESFLETKSDLASKASQMTQLQEENRGYRVKCESLTQQNQELKQKSSDLEVEMKRKISQQDALLSKCQQNITSLNIEVQKEKDNVQLENQKQQLLQTQIEQLVDVNQQLQQKLKEFQTKHQEQLLKQQQLEFTIQQQKQSIQNQSEKLNENQSVYNKLLKSNQEILKFNEDLQKNDASQKVIEDLNQEKIELIGKLNLLLTENENLIKLNEKQEKQIKSKIEEIDIKKKLLLQFQKENENFRSQINNLPQIDRVETLLDTQKGQNQMLMQRLQEREREIQIITHEMEEIRIKLIQYQQKEQLLNQEDAVTLQQNHYKSQILQLNTVNGKIQNENQQLYDLLKLRKQEISILTEKLEKKGLNPKLNIQNQNQLNKLQSNK